jgi:hypothetical protein
MLENRNIVVFASAWMSFSVVVYLDQYFVRFGIHVQLTSSTVPSLCPFGEHPTAIFRYISFFYESLKITTE